MKFDRLLAEMKRRHVFRVMTVYGAVAFVILQVADIAFPGLGLPDWAMRLVLVFLLLGFPIAVVLAWAFETTPEGPKRTVSAEPGELAKILAAPARSRWPTGLAALAGVALLAVGAWWTLRSPDPADRKYDSIAVLPFVNMSGEAENEYLGDGLAEELLNALVRIPGLKVASRTSSFAFKGTTADVRAIADSLGVEAVLEGSVRRSGEALRITAQLIAGEDGYHLWSQTYDLAAGDLLDIQDALTREILDALAMSLAAEDQPHTASRATEDETAYNLYLQGRYFWNKRTPPDMRVAIGFFEQAIEADPGFAPAYAAIADSYVVPSGWKDGVTESLDKAEEYALLALEADPTLAQAHAALGLVYLNRDLNLVKSERSFRRAIDLDPQYATAHQWYAETLVGMGRHEEALLSARHAASLDPTEIIRWSVARILYFDGRYGDALEQLDLNAELDSQSFREPLIAFVTYANQGDYESVFRMVETLAPAGFVAQVRDSLAARGEDASGPWFRQALARFLDNAPAPVRQGMDWPALVVWMSIEPDTVWSRLEALDPSDGADRYTWFNILADAAFDPLRQNPRFAVLNGEFGVIGLPDG